jgi:hypothetical protein
VIRAMTFFSPVAGSDWIIEGFCMILALETSMAERRKFKYIFYFILFSSLEICGISPTSGY